MVPDLMNKEEDTASCFMSLLFHWMSFGSNIHCIFYHILERDSGKKTLRASSESGEDKGISTFKERESIKIKIKNQREGKIYDNLPFTVVIS